MSAVMEQEHNELGLPIGYPVPDWVAPAVPGDSPLVGQYCTVEPLHAQRHGAALFQAFASDAEHRSWVYLPYGPFAVPEDLHQWLTDVTAHDDPLFHAIVDHASDQAVGVASYLRITPASGSIEVGHINFSPAMQRTRVATETMYLMMRQVFELGYRRYEWKCDALNARSCAAARRLGFVFEGVFRQATLYKGRNRDTAWYSITDREWPAVQTAMEVWLDAGNFDAEGRQRQALQVRPGGAG